MKRYISTTLYEHTYSDGLTARLPQLNGKEHTENLSVYPFDDGTALVRIAGSSTAISTALDDAAASAVTEADAMASHPTVESPERFDVPDSEADGMLSQFTISDLLDQTAIDELLASSVNPWETEADIPSTATGIRSYSQQVTAGGSKLQNQEIAVMVHAAKALGRERAADLSPKPDESVSGELGATTAALLRGEQDAHEAMLTYLRGNGPAPWVGEVNPPLKGRP